MSDKGSKFEVFFNAPYDELKKVLTDTIKANQRIIDLGAYNGGLEDFLDTLGRQLTVECVDVDEGALSELKAKKYQNVEIDIVVQDANDFIEHYAGNGADAVLLSAVLHEINTPSDQRKYLQHFFKRMGEILKPDGQIIVGDFYCPDSVTEEEFESFREYQLKAINHADTRDKFIKLELLSDVAQENNFSVEYSKEIRAVKEIDRRYYVVVLRKQ